jgi:hypothetical protein
MRWIKLALITTALAACGQEQDQPADMLPQPSGPPLAQQQAPAPVQPARAAAPRWESVVSGQGNALRLVEAGGGEAIRLACYGRPPKLIAYVPSFRSIGSEDRFSLGLGDEPVVLVANLGGSERGVEASAALTDNLGALLDRAERITASYGAQQSGPHPAPAPELSRAFAANCAKLRP